MTEGGLVELAGIAPPPSDCQFHSMTARHLVVLENTGDDAGHSSDQRASIPTAAIPPTTRSRARRSSAMLLAVPARAHYLRCEGHRLWGRGCGRLGSRAVERDHLCGTQVSGVVADIQRPGHRTSGLRRERDGHRAVGSRQQSRRTVVRFRETVAR